MGLDIRAYGNLKEVNNSKLDEYGYPINNNQWKPGAGMEWSESIWPGRGEPIDSCAVYEYDDLYEFRAGSYIGYNWWREKLGEFAVENAFQELIDFADNEGVLGTKVSEKLYYDFAGYHDKAMKYSKSLSNNGESWFDRYCKWEKAFDVARNNGAVEFL